MPDEFLERAFPSSTRLRSFTFLDAESSSQRQCTISENLIAMTWAKQTSVICIDPWCNDASCERGAHLVPQAWADDGAAFTGAKPKMPRYFAGKYGIRESRPARQNAWGQARDAKAADRDPSPPPPPPPAEANEAGSQVSADIKASKDTAAAATASTPRSIYNVPTPLSALSRDTHASYTALETQKDADRPLLVGDKVYAWFYTDWFPAQVTSVDADEDTATVLWDGEWSSSVRPRSWMSHQY